MRPVPGSGLATMDALNLGATSESLVPATSVASIRAAVYLLAFFKCGKWPFLQLVECIVTSIVQFMIQFKRLAM